MPLYSFYDILQAVTVASSDDGRQFTDTTRIDAIRRLLQGSAYTLIHEDPLFLLYGRPTVRPDEVVLISTHVDCVYSRCFCHDEGECCKGTFDNSLTNAAVIYDMLAGTLPDNVCIAFTGDEEKDSQGARSLISWMDDHGYSLRFALVTDVTNEGWTDNVHFTLENDLEIDLFTAFRIVSSLDACLYTFIHHAEPDESWDYAGVGIPAITLCIPVLGDIHSDDGVLVRKSSLPAYCRVLALLSAVVSA